MPTFQCASSVLSVVPISWRAPHRRTSKSCTLMNWKIKWYKGNSHVVISSTFMMAGYTIFRYAEWPPGQLCDWHTHGPKTTSSNQEKLFDSLTEKLYNSCDPKDAVWWRWSTLVRSRTRCRCLQHPASSMSQSWRNAEAGSTGPTVVVAPAPWLHHLLGWSLACHQHTIVIIYCRALNLAAPHLNI